MKLHLVTALLGLAAWPTLFAQRAAAPADRTPAEEFVQWAEPPGPATAAEVARIERVRSVLDGGTGISTVLADATYMSIHDRPEFRKLIEDHAGMGPLTLCGPEEPGTRMRLTLELVDGEGRPIPGALVYVYHTSAKGWYSDRGAHVRANSGDVKHARLFGYALTDAQGRVEIRTIRPVGYPRSELPAHVHVHFSSNGRAVAGGEVQFDDDPRLTPARRAHSEQEGAVIVSVERLDDASQRCSARFVARP